MRLEQLDDTVLRACSGVMRLDLLDEAALWACSPERLITLIAWVQQLIDTATAYQ